MATDAVFAAAMADLAETLGTAAVYAPAVGDPVSLQVNMEIEVEQQPGGYEGPAWAQIQTIEGLLADFGQEPNEGDTIEIDSTTYTVKRVLENDGIFCKVAVR